MCHEPQLALLPAFLEILEASSHHWVRKKPLDLRIDRVHGLAVDGHEVIVAPERPIHLRAVSGPFPAPLARIVSRRCAEQGTMRVGRSASDGKRTKWSATLEASCATSVRDCVMSVVVRQLVAPSFASCTDGSET